MVSHEEELRLSVFEVRVLGMIFGPKRGREHKNDDDYTMSRFIMFNLQKIFFQESHNVMWGMQHACGN